MRNAHISRKSTVMRADSLREKMRNLL